MKGTKLIRLLGLISVIQLVFTNLPRSALSGRSFFQCSASLEDWNFSVQIEEGVLRVSGTRHSNAKFDCSFRVRLDDQRTSQVPTIYVYGSKIRCTVDDEKILLVLLDSVNLVIREKTNEASIQLISYLPEMECKVGHQSLSRLLRA